jgi:hypothetical protein
MVDIIIVMAAGTGAGQTDLASHWFLVARQAVEATMRTIQLEGGASVVVEIPGLPVARVMAGSAIGPQPQLVFIIFLVTGIAISLGILEGGSQVAFFAFHLRVFTQQRETRQAVVETGFLPVALVMAGLALLAFLSLVLVILLVTGVTGGREFLLIQDTGMAA